MANLKELRKYVDSSEGEFARQMCAESGYCCKTCASRYRCRYSPHRLGY